MEENNIWEALNLSEENIKTSYDYLISQAENFERATKGELLMDIEVSSYTSDAPSNRKMTLYYLVIIAPNLGSFRKKILHIAEFEDVGRFPVNIMNYINSHFYEDINEDDLLVKMKDILAEPQVQNVIEKLYRQSLEAKGDN
ncbi:MAG: hypothetical protein ABF242_05485 [Flavobacteriales bacterium]